MAALQAVAVGPELATPIPWRPEPGMPRGPHPEPGVPREWHGDPHAPHRGGREPPTPQPGGGGPAMPQPARSAQQPRPIPNSPAVSSSPSEAPPHAHPVRPPGPPESGELGELPPRFTEASQRGRWVRDGGRIIIIGA
jgi:hypothetical protein